jgi:lysophospholipase L1-like esterase
MSKRGILLAAASLMIGVGAMIAGAQMPKLPTLPKAPAGTDQVIAATQKLAGTAVAADQPSPKVDKMGQPEAGFIKRHEAYVALAKKGGIDLYFIGDSITDGWHGGGKDVWNKEFAGWNPGNFGISGDRTQHVLWRLQNGELDGVTPKAFVIMIGTNNLGANTNEQIVAGNTAIVKTLVDKDPQAKILLLGIFPRGEKATDPNRQRIKDINTELAKLDDGKNIKFLDFGAKFLTDDGTLTKDIMPDFLHPTAKGYDIWAAAIKPILTEWLGAPKAAEGK